MTEEQAAGTGSSPLVAACERAGLRHEGARLLHQRANAVYHLPGEQVIVRLRRTRGSAEWQRRLASSTRVTRWLAERGFPTVTPKIIDPVCAGEWTGTFWTYVRFALNRPDAGPVDVARVIRQLHDMPIPPISLVEANPLGSLMQDVSEAGAVLTRDQRAWLNAQATQVIEAYDPATIPLGIGLIHGDAHEGNLFPTEKGYLLGDWDSVSIGPLLQDLVPTLDGVRHFGTPEAAWEDFCDAYGVNPRIADDPRMQLLLRAREIRSLAAYIRSADRMDVKVELDKRLRTLMFHESATWRAV